MLTGRRTLIQSMRQKNGLSGFTNRFESEYDPFGAGHGCSSISAGLGIIISINISCFFLLLIYVNIEILL